MYSAVTFDKVSHIIRISVTSEMPVVAKWLDTIKEETCILQAIVGKQL